jgi:hypothetical protein
MKKLLFVYLIVIYTVLPKIVLAQCDPAKELETDLGCIPADPAGFTSRLYAIGLGFIGGAALLSIMYGGYLVMTSRGNRDQLMKGRSYIFSAIAGMVLAIVGFALYQIIAVDVIKLPGFN